MCSTMMSLGTTTVPYHPGRWVQVGSSCLKDFLGHKNPHAVAAQAEWMSLIGEAADTLGSNGTRNPTKLVLITSLAWAAESVIRHGWVSKAKAEELRQDCHGR